MTTGTTVEVSLALAGAALTDAVRDVVVTRVEADLRDLLHGLGVYRRPIVELTASPSASMLVKVDGRSCAVPDMAVAQAFAYVRESPMVSREHGGIGGQGAALLESEENDPERLAEMVSLVCRSALASEPDAQASDRSLMSLPNGQLRWIWR